MLRLLVVAEWQRCGRKCQRSGRKLNKLRESQKSKDCEIKNEVGLEVSGRVTGVSLGEGAGLARLGLIKRVQAQSELF